MSHTSQKKCHTRHTFFLQYRVKYGNFIKYLNWSIDFCHICIKKLSFDNMASISAVKFNKIQYKPEILILCASHTSHISGTV